MEQVLWIVCLTSSVAHEFGCQRSVCRRLCLRLHFVRVPSPCEQGQQSSLDRPCCQDCRRRRFSQRTFWLVKAGKAQVEFLTLMMAAFHLDEPPSRALGLCMITHVYMAYWDNWWKGASVNVIGPTCAFPASTNQNVCCEKGLLAVW